MSPSKARIMFNFEVNSVAEREKIKELLNNIKAYLSILENKDYSTSTVIIKALENYLETLKARLHK